jgi:phage portal protein BeeE
MLPIISRHEQEMNRKLFTRQEREQGYFVKFNIDALLRGDSKTRAEALALKRQNGIINANEWRSYDDQNPIEGVAGEAYLVNGASISTETAASQLPKQTGGTGNTPPQGGKGVE